MRTLTLVLLVVAAALPGVIAQKCYLAPGAGDFFKDSCERKSDTPFHCCGFKCKEEDGCNHFCCYSHSGGGGGGGGDGGGGGGGGSSGLSHPGVLAIVFYMIVGFCCCCWCCWCFLFCACQPKSQPLMMDEHDEEHGNGQEMQELIISEDDHTPQYWANQDLSEDFDERYDVSPNVEELIQKMLDDTFKPKATRDRHGEPMPVRLQLVSAQRIEDRRMWAQYLQEKKRISQERGKCTTIEVLSGGGEVKTYSATKVDESFQERLSKELNEYYLFHGTDPKAAMAISEDGFLINLAGSNAGTMFGRGAYFAEASSKSDEYAEDDKTMYPGIYSFLICRVVCGEMFRVTRSDLEAIEEAIKSGDYDSCLGDREAKVGTYREFVVYRERQIYPEYHVLYKREFADSDSDESDY